MASHAKPDPSKYFVPDGSYYPFALTAGLFAVIVGVWGYLEQKHLGITPVLIGAAAAIAIIYRWFHKVSHESEGGFYGAQVDRTFRWGMSFFIFSEVMFFGAFFGALFYARNLSVPWLGGDGVKVFTNFLLWPHFEGTWPTNGPGHVGGHADSTFEVIPAIGLPAINTLILLTSGVTITIAHHALRAGKRGTLTVFLALTFLLGFTFVGCQAHEYGEAYKELGLKLSTGIYGSTFFMLTGFHGLHVTVGAIMLLVVWLRVLRGHFTPNKHFAFEAVAWYWHFVDVVWLGLFIFVYWL